MPANARKPALKNRTAVMLMAAAAVLLLAALVWRIGLERHSLSSKIVRELASHGLSVDAAGLYQHAHAKDTSIRELMGETDMTAAVDASKQAGFSADIDRTGEVYCILSDLGEKGVLTLCLVDEDIERAFIQQTGSDEIAPIAWIGSESQPSPHGFPY